MSTALPKNEHTTKELMEVFPCPLPEKVRQNALNLGVSRRFLVDRLGSTSRETVLDEGKLVDLCLKACEKTLRAASVPVKDVGYFIATYDVNPFLSPGLSQLLVNRLGFNPYAKHVNAQGIASTAFPKALELARYYLAARPDDYVLICVSGVSSYWFQNQVRGLKGIMGIDEITRMKDAERKQLELRKWVAAMQFFLFGDGVAAAVVANGDGGLSVGKIVEVTNLREKDYMAGYARLTSSNEPFRFGFHSHLDKEIPNLGAEYTGLALKKLFGNDLESALKNIKKWVVHTGSERILNVLAERHGISSDKLEESHSVLKEYGNLAGASLPFILEKIVSGAKLSAEDLILMVGYGWGFSAAAGLLHYSQ